MKNEECRMKDPGAAPLLRFPFFILHSAFSILHSQGVMMRQATGKSAWALAAEARWKRAQKERDGEDGVAALFSSA
ncbi:MAG: hypothetical protein IMZ44_01990 [Planctomycetes bacterium]|nr:hypothetical protein [Planctomycetota bacterium]